VLGPVLREALVSEAMFHLGIPTTQVLAAVSTGEWIQREQALPGAVLCRVAASHLRIGSVQFLGYRGQLELTQQLVHYTLARHFPESTPTDRPAATLLREVALSQAELIAQWMAVGFVHGVMNTDNMTLSGETIDYGPCAFLDVYDQDAVFSSIDRGGRYAYKNQPLIGKWNIARLAEALLPLLGEGEAAAVEAAQQVLTDYQNHYNEQMLVRMRAKLGLRDARQGDQDLVAEFLGFLQESAADFTSTFRTLAHDLSEFGAPQWGPMGQELADRYLARLGGESLAQVAARMNQVNPKYIPRNHRVEEVLAAAHRGDLEPFHAFSRVLALPYDEQPEQEKYAEPAPPGFGPYRTFCGT
jgi:serine/tyrosine/threonine adenylyltransferase